MARFRSSAQGQCAEQNRTMVHSVCVWGGVFVGVYRRLMRPSPHPLRTVRDKLARLSQMSLLLGFEAADEVLDYWAAPGAAAGGGGEGGGGGGITWRLSASEVRAVLLQRADFSKEAIMVLPI